MVDGTGAGSRLDELELLAGAGSWTFDHGSGALGWSEGQYRLHGTSPGAVRSVDEWAALVHPDDQPLFRATFSQAARGEGATIDHRIVRADDGSVRWLRSRARRVEGRLSGVSLDTTNEHDAAESMRTFIADAAHELRTPAAAIGQAVSALEVVDGDHRDEVIAVLTRQAARLRRLTTDLVDLAQLDSGPVAIVLQAVPLAPAVAEAVQHAPPPEGRSIRVEVPDGLEVLATSGHLDRILVNLLTNAYRYGGPTVTIRAREHEGRAVVEVADDGPGIPEEATDGLFKAFRRGPQRHPEASGLGLAIVGRLVHRFGGTVSYRQGDPGAVFVLDLERPG